MARLRWTYLHKRLGFHVVLDGTEEDLSLLFVSSSILEDINRVDESSFSAFKLVLEVFEL